MKTYKHIFDEMLKEENIRQCFHDAAKRKTTRPEVARVLKEEREVGNDRPDPQCLQEHVKALQKILEEETFKPPEHRKQLINEYSCGKVREIIKPELEEAMQDYLKNEMHQKIKYNWQVFRFEYPDRKAPPVIDKKTGKEKPKTRGRALDFMGFVFHYNRTTLRKSILKRATKKAHRIAKKEKVNWYDASAMLASMGWFTHTDTYGFYEDHIKPYVNIKQLKKKVSKHSKKGVKNNDVRMVSVRKHGQADRVGHDIKPDSGLSAKEHRRADQEGH